jgi:hypothetical protein
MGMLTVSTNATRRRTCRVVFERLMGAARTRLSRNRCGYRFEGRTFVCFEGHEDFDDERRWDRGYKGPDFFTDRDWCHRMEAHVKDLGLVRPYIMNLLSSVFPRWDKVQSESEVYDLWFSLANASPEQRVLAAYKIASDPLFDPEFDPRAQGN